MKKVIASVTFGFILTIVLASCGSAQHGHCDAYGDAPTGAPSELPLIK
jgi:hypothetical protein